MSTEPVRATMLLDVRPGEVHRARLGVRSLLDDDPRADDAVLATSELVSNAIKYGAVAPGMKILLEVSLLTDRVRVEITYTGKPYSREEVESGTEGYGLRILSALTRDWDVESHDHEVMTWFEI